MHGIDGPVATPHLSWRPAQLVDTSVAMVTRHSPSMETKKFLAG
jgi:hypothetical protein